MVGAIILILGGMHFFNMLVFFKLRKRALQEKRLNSPEAIYRNPADTTNSEGIY